MSYRYRTFTTSGEDFTEWSGYYARLKNKGAYHSPEYISLLEKHYGDEAVLFVYEEGDEFVYYPFFKRSLEGLELSGVGFFEHSKYFDIVSSWYYGGPLTSNYSDQLIRGFSEAFSTYCVEGNIVSEFVRFDPYIANHENAHAGMTVVDNREVVYIDLTPGEDTILQSYRHKCRKNIFNKALKGGVTVDYKHGPAELEKFFHLYDSEMRRKNASVSYFFDLNFFKELLSRVPGALLVSIYVNGDYAGGSIALKDGTMAHDYLRAVDNRYRGLGISDFVIHQNVCFFKKEGAFVYDLQGGRDGVFEFKKSFSKLTRHFKVGQAIHLPDVYAELCSKALVKSEDYFPAYRVKISN